MTYESARPLNLFNLGPHPSLHARERSAIYWRLKSAALAPVGTVASLFDVKDVVGLTFDDGPDDQVTPRLLEVLGRHDAKATFFVLTDHASRHPHLIKQLVEAGHEVALHFDRHDRITRLPPLAAWRRMKAARDILTQLAGRPTLFRPPYGSQNYLTFLFARLLGFRVIGWSQCANDWMHHSAQKAARDATETLSGGDIILMHDGLVVEAGETLPSLDRVEVADLVLAEAAARGLRSVTISTLLQRGPARFSHWFR